MERRTVALATSTVQRRSGNGSVTISGIGLPFDTPADIGGIVEVWDPGAFDAQAGANWKGWEPGPNRSILGLWNHDPNQVLASIDAGTMKLRATRTALLYSMTLPPSASYIAELVERGDARGASVSFTATQALWGQTADGTPERRITAATLFELSLCAWPVFATTTATLGGAPARLLDKALEADSIGVALETDSARRLTARDVDRRMADFGRRYMEDKLVDLRMTDLAYRAEMP